MSYVFIMHIIFISTVNIDLKLSRNSSATASELCRKSEIYIYTMYIHNLYDTKIFWKRYIELHA